MARADMTGHSWTRTRVPHAVTARLKSIASLRGITVEAVIQAAVTDVARGDWLPKGLPEPVPLEQIQS